MTRFLVLLCLSCTAPTMPDGYECTLQTTRWVDRADDPECRVVLSNDTTCVRAEASDWGRCVKVGPGEAFEVGVSFPDGLGYRGVAFDCAQWDAVECESALREPEPKRDDEQR